MKNIYFLVTASLLILALSSCKKEGAGSGVTPASRDKKTTQVTVSSVLPATGKVYGTVEITGAGFGSHPSFNYVTFGGVEGIITAATTTKLTVTIPPGAKTGDLIVWDRITNNHVVIKNYKIKQLTLAAQIATPDLKNTPYVVPDRVNKGYLYCANATSIFKLAPNGTYKMIYNVYPSMKAVAEIRDIENDSKGNLFIAVASGSGSRQPPTAFDLIMMSPNGTVTKLTKGTPGDKDGPINTAEFQEIFNLELARVNTGGGVQESLYIETIQGIRKMAANGVVTKVKSFSMPVYGYASLAIIDGKGNFYGGTNRGRLLKMTPLGDVSVVDKYKKESSGGLDTALSLGVSHDGRNYITMDHTNDLRIIYSNKPSLNTLQIINGSGYLAPFKLPASVAAKGVTAIKFDDLTQRLYIIGGTTSIYTF